MHSLITWGICSKTDTESAGLGGAQSCAFLRVVLVRGPHRELTQNLGLWTLVDWASLSLSSVRDLPKATQRAEGSFYQSDPADKAGS